MAGLRSYTLVLMNRSQKDHNWGAYNDETESGRTDEILGLTNQYGESQLKVLRMLSTGVRAIDAWLEHKPILRKRNESHPLPPRENYVTGAFVVGQIKQALMMRQPVVLVGPRGCGKSWCAEQAVIELKKEGRLHDYVKVQGNKDLPRDYLLEDEIGFQLEESGSTRSVVPVPLSAPLLRFATRTHDKYGDIKERDGWIEITDGKPFGLFVDELNRFSDGVLDSLLLLLEEQQVIIRGRPLKIDARVVMTMNPPGYDATAKRLSPPLQARIARMYDLCTPGIDTLVGIAKNKVKRFEETEKADVARDSDEVLRRACFVTLALWGEIGPEEGAYVYLTRDTHERLRELKDHAPDIRLHMRAIRELCTYGPDARAAGDWVAAALAQDALGRGDNKGQVTLTVKALRDQLVPCILHRLSDRHSDSDTGEALELKTRAIKAIANVILDGTTPAIIVAPWYERETGKNSALSETLACLPDVVEPLGSGSGDWQEVVRLLDIEIRAIGVPEATDAVQICATLALFGKANRELQAQGLSGAKSPIETWVEMCHSESIGRMIGRILGDDGKVLSMPLLVLARRLNQAMDHTDEPSDDVGVRLTALGADIVKYIIAKGAARDEGYISRLPEILRPFLTANVVSEALHNPWGTQFHEASPAESVRDGDRIVELLRSITSRLMSGSNDGSAENALALVTEALAKKYQLSARQSALYIQLVGMAVSEACQRPDTEEGIKRLLDELHRRTVPVLLSHLVRSLGMPEDVEVPKHFTFARDLNPAETGALLRAAVVLPQLLTVEPPTEVPMDLRHQILALTNEMTGAPTARLRRRIQENVGDKS
jgi:MoxR-like ATPase